MGGRHSAGDDHTVCPNEESAEDHATDTIQSLLKNQCQTGKHQQHPAVTGQASSVPATCHLPGSRCHPPTSWGWEETFYCCRECPLFSSGLSAGIMLLGGTIAPRVSVVCLQWYVEEKDMEVTTCLAGLIMI